MTADTDENDLAAVAPDLIIYGGLTYAADFYLDERRDIFEAKVPNSSCLNSKSRQTTKS